MEEARFLARRSEEGYVSSPAQGLPGEPQAISEAEQVELTERAERRERAKRIDARTATLEDIERELAYVDARGRYLRRQVARLRRKV